MCIRDSKYIFILDEKFNFTVFFNKQLKLCSIWISVIKHCNTFLSIVQVVFVIHTMYCLNKCWAFKNIFSVLFKFPFTIEVKSDLILFFYNKVYILYNKFTEFSHIYQQLWVWLCRHMCTQVRLNLLDTL